jgi:HK97 family phage prohead protease
MSEKLEHKILPFTIEELKETKNDAGLNVVNVTGYAAVKNNVDLGGDRIVDGAFKKGIRANKGKWPIQLDHDHRISATAGENISAKEDDTGLFTEFEILLDSESGRDAAVKMRHAKSAGRPMGLSIGYRAPGWEYVKDKNGESIRELKEINVFEHSLTNFPMNPKATVLTVKSICESGDKEAIALEDAQSQKH